MSTTDTQPSALAALGDRLDQGSLSLLVIPARGDQLAVASLWKHVPEFGPMHSIHRGETSAEALAKTFDALEEVTR